MGEACGFHASLGSACSAVQIRIRAKHRAWIAPSGRLWQGPIIGARIEYSLGTLLDVGPEGWVKPIGSQPKHARSGGFMGYSP